jgi:hypothetical protein
VKWLGIRFRVAVFIGGVQSSVPACCDSWTYLRGPLCFNWAPRHKGVLGEWRYSSTHPLTSALDGGEWSAPRPGCFTPRERAPWYPLDRKLGGDHEVLNSSLSCESCCKCYHGPSMSGHLSMTYSWGMSVNLKKQVPYTLNMVDSHGGSFCCFSLLVLIMNNFSC